jgi:hypothetical protein
LPYQTDRQLPAGHIVKPFSESWMREMRLSCSMSGKKKQNQVKPD